jgi:ABC-type uncharacterized transport system substrate-binding protein
MIGYLHLSADLVQRKVNVIAATSTPAALAAKAATATIPVVFTTIADPVQIGLVTSIRSNVDVIVQDSTIGTQVAKRATSTIPIVMALVLDPIGSGLVERLTHPGGNITGLSMMAMELYPKRLQLLKEINPQLTRAAVWWNPDHPFHPKAVEEIKAAAPSLSIELSFAAAKARTVRSRLLGSHPSKRPGAVRSR